MALQVPLNARFDISHPHSSKSSFNLAESVTTSSTTTEISGSSGIGTLANISEPNSNANTRKPKANRRQRSLISFFLPPSFLSTSSGFTLCRAGTLPLPPDIMLAIGSLVSSSTLLNLVLASSAFYDILLPSLYRTLVLPSSDHCLAVLPRLDRVKAPKRLGGIITTGRMLCSYIRELDLKPNYCVAWPRKDRKIDENWVSGMVEKLAKKGWLADLESFGWEGLEIPRDEMWEALRFGCPRLKNILTIVGAKLIGPQSKLFDFSNLTSFSMLVRYIDGFDAGTRIPYPPLDDRDTRSETIYPNTPTPLPPKFWDMINTRCSQTLCGLHICSLSPVYVTFDVAPLFRSASANTSAPGTRFPNLTSLTLGVFGYKIDHTVPTTPCMLLGKFLANHPSITYLRILWYFKRRLSPDDLPFFPPLSETSLSLPQRQDNFLPKLDTFVGVYQQLASIPLESRKHIHTIDLTCEPMFEARALKTLELLKTVQGLKVLVVWIHLPSHVEPSGGERSERIFTKLVDACMGLEEMGFMCTTPISMKFLEHFLHCLSQLAFLRRFSLTKGHIYPQVNPAYKPDESMFDTAVRVFRACKGVTTVSVRYTREGCLNNVKKEGVYEVIERDANTGGITLAANETGISLLGRPYKKRYRQQVVD